jgi:hypothetical protein
VGAFDRRLTSIDIASNSIAGLATSMSFDVARNRVSFRCKRRSNLGSVSQAIDHSEA